MKRFIKGIFSMSLFQAPMIWGTLSVLWGAIVFIAYYFVHKPVTLEQGIVLGRLSLILLGWVGSLALANLIGSFLAPQLQRYPAHMSFALQVGLGFGVLGFFLLILGVLRGYWPLLAWGIVVAALPRGLPTLLHDVREVIPRIPKGHVNKALACFVGFIMIAAIFRALAPPTAWDALVYHLTGPKLYQQAHGLHHDLDLPYLGFPQAGSMLFLWGLLLAGPQLAQLMHLTFALLTIVLLPAVVDLIAPKRGWLAAGLLVSVPTAALLAGWAYVEWMTMYAGLACLSLIYSAAPGSSVEKEGLIQLDHEGAVIRRWQPLMLAAFYAAMAFNTKYTAVGLVLGLVLVIILEYRSSRAFAVFAGLFLLFIAPYLLKNLILTGNPVYPFFFPGMFWDSYRAYWYSRPGTGLDLVQLLTAPWDATIWGVEGGVVSGHPSYSATIGPALLALVPLVAIRFSRGFRKQNRPLRGMLVVCVMAYAVWLGMLAYSSLLAQSRMLMPIFPFLAILATAGLDALGRFGRRGASAQFVLSGLVCFAFILTALETTITFVSTSPVPVIIGVQSESDYLASRLGQYSLMIDDINELPQGSRVRFLWEPRTYHCSQQVICEPDALLDRWWHLRQQRSDANSIATQWRDEGVTHILLFHAGAQAVREEGFDPLTLQDWDVLEQFIDNYLVPLGSEDGGYTLYKLRLGG